MQLVGQCRGREVGILVLCIAPVVYICGLTPVKIFFRLRLQNLFIGVDPQTVARVEAMVSMSGRCSKGGGYGFNVGALLQGWRLGFNNCP